MKTKFVVEGLGGARGLRGTIAVRGAKNAVLKTLAASILFDDSVTIDNVPDIEDVSRVLELLEHAGATVTHHKNTRTIAPPVGGDWNSALERGIAEKLRASVVLTGPMLARTGSVTFPFPGGCVLGERPIDLFLNGFVAMGAEVEEGNDQFVVRAKNGSLVGAQIFFPIVSVTGTETLMLAAVLAKGETVLENAAMEPEILALAEYLNACGAKITGAGTPTIRIQGTTSLKAGGKTYHTPPDRIEAGSFVILGALLGEEVVVEQCEPAHMGALLSLMKQAGVDLTVGKSSVTVRGSKPARESYTMVSVRTHEYPGFPTDLQAPMAVFLTQCKGEGTVLETIFDARFRYTDDLIRMGADITVMNPHRILIKGPRALSRKELESPDLRGGLAYLIAAGVATGTSTIRNAYLIDRGYEHIEERLGALGFSIRREAE